MRKVLISLVVALSILIVCVGCNVADAEGPSEESIMTIVETYEMIKEPTESSEEESLIEESSMIEESEEESSFELVIEESEEEVESEESVEEIVENEEIVEPELETVSEESVYEESSEEIAYEEPTPVEEEPAEETPSEEVYSWTGSVLTATMGVNWGPTGKETYYNLDMSGIISAVQRGGWLYNDCINKDIIDEILDTSGYWVRDDGCKMFGPYIIVAANLDHFPRGSIVECSLGTAIVLDTGGFASMADGWSWLDIATNW